MGELGTSWELCKKYELLWWGKCGDIDLWCPNSRGNCGNFVLTKQEEIGSKLCFHLLMDEKIQKRFAGENEEVYVKIH